MPAEAKTTGSQSTADPPESPSDLSRWSLWTVRKRVTAEFKDNNLTVLAAALTYYGVLAVVPGLILIFAILGLVGKDTTHQLVKHVQSVAPGSSAHFVRTLITQAQSNRTESTVGAITALFVSLFAASSYVGAFRRASNVIYHIGEGRPIWKTIPIRIGVTIVAVVVLVVSAVIVVVSGPIAREVGDAIGAGGTTVLIWNIVKWPVLFVLISLLLAAFFWASPNAKQGGIKWISPGGVIATIGWLVVSALFAIYVVNFSSYSKVYGSLAGVVIFLVWLWLTNVALLVGAEVNAELDHERAIAEGLPSDVQPFAEPRDTQKLSNRDKRQVDKAQVARKA